MKHNLFFSLFIFCVALFYLTSRNVVNAQYCGGMQFGDYTYECRSSGGTIYCSYEPVYNPCGSTPGGGGCEYDHAVSSTCEVRLGPGGTYYCDIYTNWQRRSCLPLDPTSTPIPATPTPTPDPGMCWCGDCLAMTCQIRLIDVCNASYSGCGCTNCDIPPPPPPPSEERIVGVVLDGSERISGYTVTSSDGKTAEWHSGENGPYFSIGRWAAGTNVSITLEAPGCTYWTYDCNPGGPGCKNSGDGCTASVTIASGDYSPDWQNHLQLRLANLPCATGLDVVCHASGTAAFFSWNGIPGADRYALRINRDPLNEWFGEGDLYWEPLMNFSNISIGCNYDYGWNVQGIKPGEPYPYFGCVEPPDIRNPGNIFNCPCPASCSITAHIVELAGIGDRRNTTPVSINPPPSGGNISSMFFTVSDTGIAEITSTHPNPDTTEPYMVEMQANAIGSTTYTVVAIMDDGAATTCSSTANITVNPPTAWLQIEGGDVIVGHIDGNPGASINIPIPISEYLMTGTPPGVPIAGGTINTAPGGISSTGWSVASSPYRGDLPSYDAFRRKIPQTIPYALGGSADEATLLNMGTEYPTGSGYYYFEYDGIMGDLVIEDAGDINLNNKRVIIFADSNVNINDNIRLTKGTGFFMIIASGNITINPSVEGTNDDEPELEGVYFTDGDFSTGTNGSGADNRLHIRGVVVAANQVVPQRSNAYADIPGELFEYAPDQSMLIPPALSGRSMTWKEVLP